MNQLGQKTFNQQETNEELAALLENEKKNAAIINSLSSIFFALYYIDIEQNSFQEVISLDSIHHVYGEKDDARVSLKQMVDRLVADEYKAIMRVFTDLDTIDERLGKKSMIVQEYLAGSGEWNRCSLIPVEREW